MAATRKSPALVITLPMPLNIGNGSHGHWRTRLNQKQAYFKALDTLQAAGKIPAPPKEPLDRATVDSVMHLARQMDVDNAMRRHKWPLDWLRTRRYIVDDSPTHLSWTSFPEQRVKRNGDYKIVLTFSQKAA